MTLTFAAAVLGTYAVLHVLWRPAHASVWVIPTSAALVYVLGFTRANLRYNRRSEDEPVLPYLGVSNAVTLMRGLLVGVLAGFVVVPLPEGIGAFVPGLLYTAAALTDLVDGALARARDESTRLGEKLDVEMDAFGILVAVVLVVQAGQLPGAFILLGLLYYLYRAGMALRRRWGYPVEPLPEHSWRKRIGGAWVVFLCIALYPVFAPPATTLAGSILGGLLLLSFAWDVAGACGHSEVLQAGRSVLDRVDSADLLLVFRGLGGSAALMIPIIATQPSFSFVLPEESFLWITFWIGLAAWLFSGQMPGRAAGMLVAAASWGLTVQGGEIGYAASLITGLGIVLLDNASRTNKDVHKNV